MKLTIGTRLGSTNTRINIRNLHTHFLLQLYRSGSRPVWLKGGRTYRALSKTQRRAVYDLLRLRMVKAGSLKAEV
jgi:hypothetical protein